MSASLPARKPAQMLSKSARALAATAPFTISVACRATKMQLNLQIGVSKPQKRCIIAQIYTNF
eukprot:scaffold64054_cov42-Prasinocladus_malaysianus.AAC.1